MPTLVLHLSSSLLTRWMLREVQLETLKPDFDEFF